MGPLARMVPPVGKALWPTEYTEDARLAKYQGTVVVSAEIGTDGLACLPPGKRSRTSRGSVVVLFATGQGPSDPDWAEDVLAAEPLPKPVNLVKVTIGGQAGEILYAGAAPGMAGVMQVNVRIPAGTKAGSTVPVVLSVGIASSQPGVTLAVQ